ncbi:MAG: CPBP family intramembrane metalloprotease [Anaerolineae bacterium]|nr:CPBP family intramembrane metalloprotease [Anaerolineae bacterium]
METSIVGSNENTGTVRAFIKKHSLIIYFALAFAISWGGILIVAGPGGIPGTPEQVEALLPPIYVAMLAGPGIAGILMIGLVCGKAGFRDLLSRLLRWRVGARWYAAAILIAPVAAMATLFAFSLASPVFLPGIVVAEDKAAVLLTGAIVGVLVGLFEETGWTGFAIPVLRERQGTLVTGLIVGVLWGVWHLLLFVWTSGTPSGALSLSLFLPALIFCLGVLPAYRVLMVWVTDHTASLLVAILMHAGLTGGVALVIMPAATGTPLMVWYLVFTAALWGIAAIAISKTNGTKSTNLKGEN